MTAARYGDKATIVSILDGHPNLHLINNSGMTAIHIACMVKNEKVIPDLIKAKADVQFYLQNILVKVFVKRFMLFKILIC